jgi:hypothetical protein
MFLLKSISRQVFVEESFQQKHASRYSSTNNLHGDAFQQKHASRYSSTNNLPVDAFQQKHASRYSSTKTCLLMLFNRSIFVSSPDAKDCLSSC